MINNSIVKIKENISYKLVQCNSSDIISSSPFEKFISEISIELKNVFPCFNVSSLLTNVAVTAPVAMIHQFLYLDNKSPDCQVSKKKLHFNVFYLSGIVLSTNAWNWYVLFLSPVITGIF